MTSADPFQPPRKTKQNLKENPQTVADQQNKSKKGGRRGEIEGEEFHGKALV